MAKHPERTPSEKCSGPGCPLCRLAENPRYAAMWAGQPIPPLRVVPEKLGTCKHFGQPTGEQASCEPCGRNVSLKLFQCSIHGKCTPTKKVENIQCCSGCPDYVDPKSQRAVVPNRMRRSNTIRIAHVFRHGLGDAIQFAAALRLAKEVHPEWSNLVLCDERKSEAFTGIAETTQDEQEARRADVMIVHPWDENFAGYEDRQSTKAAKFLTEQFDIKCDKITRLRYKIDDSVMAKYADLPDKIRAMEFRGEPYVTFHFSGMSMPERKSLGISQVNKIVSYLVKRNRNVLLLDWSDSRIELGKRIRKIGPRYSLFNFADLPTVGRLAAVLAGSELNVSIDSGPGKIAAAIPEVPCITIWTGFHPILYLDPHPHIVSLVPWNHESLVRGDRWKNFFRANYRHYVYNYLSESFVAAYSEIFPSKIKSLFG